MTPSLSVHEPGTDLIGVAATEGGWEPHT
ncbi:MAG: hypothetical protein QOI50_598, partial [Pseudonocardiales bacterium]|nr:hypothetical protein [Pseudonocardiales bacterium]